MILNYSSKREKRKLIYFSERKNNQGLKAVHPLQSGSNATEEYGRYKTSNSTGTSRRTTGNGYTILKGSVLFSYSGKKGEYGTLSCKNDDRHPYDKWNTDTATKRDLPELEKSDRETGGIMLNVTGMNRFYYLRNFHDMRCKYERVLSIIHQQLNHELQEDEVFIAMSELDLFLSEQ